LCIGRPQSAEDVELREKLALLVERVKDSDPGLVKTSLEAMRFAPSPPQVFGL
jgi:hypothetical protein